MISLDQRASFAGWAIFFLGCLEASDLLFGIEMGHHFGVFRPSFSATSLSGRHFYKGGTDEALGH